MSAPSFGVACKQLRSGGRHAVFGGCKSLLKSELAGTKSRPVGAADLRDLVSQVKMVAGAGNHLKLLFHAAA
jgi:hypothetical protein